ncbi:PD-(D/E)XK nuclease family protein [Aquipuribacter hungaricus]|uniref:PD-(D/E)XK nuclease family protein n=1 Tax=Aquipuribacter hungaricus TaxID=545624 RepID=A0ABV7WDV1_9MICO
MQAVSSLDQTIIGLVPSLSRSLAAQFNVFRVMRHGTHEKQLSNVFAWLLDADATHELGDRGQRIFLELVNNSSPIGTALPTSGYTVTQEVNTLGPQLPGKDIADIVLTGPDACVVIENYGTSDGHDHDYYSYLEHGRLRAKNAVVVLLCARHEPHLQTAGWDEATVVTYGDLLSGLQSAVHDDRGWKRNHPQQHSSLDQLFQHFLKGPAALDLDDRIAFLTTMCETGESARYGYRPQDVAAQEFAELVAQHARRQFDEGRQALSELKRSLKTFAQTTLSDQLSERVSSGRVVKVEARFSGQWEWGVALRRADSSPTLFIVFGPTVVAENALVPVPLEAPDFKKLFVVRQAPTGSGLDCILQTEVLLTEVFDGLPREDVRLRDALLELIALD